MIKRVSVSFEALLQSDGVAIKLAKEQIRMALGKDKVIKFSVLSLDFSGKAIVIMGETEEE